MIFICTMESETGELHLIHPDPKEQCNLDDARKAGHVKNLNLGQLWFAIQNLLPDAAEKEGWAPDTPESVAIEWMVKNLICQHCDK